jgi:hypothetical protein
MTAEVQDASQGATTFSWNRKSLRRNITNGTVELDSISASYSWGSEYESRLGDQLAWLTYFVLLFIPSRQMPELYHEKDH